MSEWCEFKQARLWTACEGTGDSTGGRAHSPRVFPLGPRSPTRVQVFVANAWICAQRVTDRDLESSSARRKVNARICAHQSTDRDLESVLQRECLDTFLSDNRP